MEGSLNEAAARSFSEAELAALVPHPAADANKFTRGRLVVVGGSATYPGAAVLAACAGQRMGAGYTEVFCAAESASVVRAARSSLVVRPWEGLVANDLVAARASKPVAVVVGPGVDAADTACTDPVFAALRARSAVLVDGGALSLLASAEGREAAQERAAIHLPTVVTPHAGEAARLAAPFDLPTGDAAALAEGLARAYGAVAVVKGPTTWVSDGDRTACMDEGTPALAKAGTGDVLAGIIGGLLAQGVMPFEAAFLGATIHARAGRAAAERLTDTCVVPEDVVDAIPQAVRAFEVAAGCGVGMIADGGSPIAAAGEAKGAR